MLYVRPGCRLVSNLAAPEYKPLLYKIVVDDTEYLPEPTAVTTNQFIRPYATPEAGGGARGGYIPAPAKDVEMKTMQMKLRGM